MRGNADALGVGAGGARAERRRPSSARRTSARCSRTSSATSTDVHEVPPGVDVDEWRPRPRDEALAGLLEEARRDPPNPGNANERLPDEGNAERLAVVPRRRRSRPSSTSGSSSTTRASTCCSRRLRTVDARAVIVGFGDYREELERMAGPRTLFTGPLEHRHLVHLLALADATVVPSIFPEAFGMVAAEAAAAGSPPLVARHSGLAEIADGLEEEYPPHLRHLAGFADRRRGRAGAEAQRAARAARRRSRRAPRAPPASATVARWSWAGVARRLLEPFNYAPRMGDEQRLGYEELLAAARRGVRRAAPTSRSRSRRSSRCSIRRRSTSSTGSRRCRRRRRGRRSSRTSSAS